MRRDWQCRLRTMAASDLGQRSCIRGRPGSHFHHLQPPKRLVLRSAAHAGVGLQRPAHRRPLGSAEKPAAQVVIQLRAGHTRRLARRHAGDGRADRRGRAAGGTSRAAFHSQMLSPGWKHLMPARQRLNNNRNESHYIIGGRSAPHGVSCTLGHCLRRERRAEAAAWPSKRVRSRMSSRWSTRWRTFLLRPVVGSAQAGAVNVCGSVESQPPCCTRKPLM